MKKTVKVILASILSFALIFSLTSCSAQSSAEKTVESYFEALCSGDFEKSNEYVLTVGEESKDENMEESSEDVYLKHFFKTFKYEILSSEKENKNTVNVKIKFDTIDMTKILPEYLLYGAQLSMLSDKDESLTEEKIQEKIDEFMVRSLTYENASRRQVEATAKVVKHDGKWVIAAEEEFFDAVTGGMISFGHAMDEA